MGLYGSGMHDFILMELELGNRVAMAQDDEDCGYGILLDMALDPGRWGALVPQQGC